MEKSETRESEVRRRLREHIRNSALEHQEWVQDSKNERIQILALKYGVPRDWVEEVWETTI